MHRQLLKVLFTHQLEGFLLALPGSLQEALGKENFTLLNNAPQRVMPHVVTAGHLFGLLHHGERFGQFTLTVEDFAMYRGGDDAAVIVGQRQLFQGHHRQTFRLVLVAVVNRHLRAQGVEIAMHRGIHFDAHLLLGARQQGVDFAVAMLALHQPGLQQDQARIFQQI